MSFIVRLNSGARTLKAEAGEPLVQVLRNARLRIPSACGGRGRCGLCRVRIAQDLGPLNELEAKKITPDERACGCHLSCQVKVDRDLDVALPENLVGSRDYRVRVTAVTRVTHDIARVRVELLEPTAIEFKAGQFMEFETPLRQADGAIACRTYSLASAPLESPCAEFMVRKVPGGLVSGWIFDQVKPGDELKLAGPFGEFHLNPGERDLIFIAGGSGMAPFASILKEMQHRKDPRRVRYFSVPNPCATCSTWTSWPRSGRRCRTSRSSPRSANRCRRTTGPARPASSPMSSRATSTTARTPTPTSAAPPA